MNEVLIITGKANIGKTTFAKKLVESKNAVWPFFNNSKYGNSDFWLSDVTPETKVIVLDGVDFNGKNNIVNLIKSPQLRINRKGQYPITVDRPEIIIISNSPYIDFNILPVYAKVIEIIK